MSRLLGVGAAVAAAAVLVAGCGSSGTQRAAEQRARQRGDSRDGCCEQLGRVAGESSDHEGTRARFARAVNLTAADVPEAKASHRRESSDHEHPHAASRAHNMNW